MPTNEQQSVSDLRGHSVEKRRATSTKAKWHPRWASPMNPNTKEVGGKARPAKLGSQGYHAQIRASKEPDKHKAKISRKQDPLWEDTDHRYDTSSDESFASDEHTPNVEGIEEVTFSYDAPRGPSKGNDVFEAALSKAVERFEDHQTTILIRDEYDVLGNVAESEAGDLGDDDDYELI